MTIERDDPEGLHASVENENGQTLPRAEEDESLFAWARAAAHDRLPRSGFTAEEVETILAFAFVEYGRVRESIRNPHLFFGRQILARARAYKRLRAIEPPPRNEPPQNQPPHLHDVIMARSALALLTPTARRALEMLFFERRQYEEVAEELDVSLAYAERLAQLAVEHLERWLAPEPPQE